MLNETASSVEDRPALRSTIRPGEDNVMRDEIRAHVMSVFAIERESFESDKSTNSGDENLLLVGRDSRLVATFEGRLLIGSEAAYDQLDQLLAAENLLPLFREANGKHVIHIVSGRVHPQPRHWWLNAVLFVVTLFSVLLVGAEMAINEIAASDPTAVQPLIDNLLFELWRGIPYAGAIMLILGAHELGHYFAARHHKIAVTLPYFIPAPFISLIGTFGAFIQLREPMRNRKQLLDIGAAGPLAGLVFAVPILLIGLATSSVGPINPGGMIEGNSLLYALAKVFTFGRFLPSATADVYVNQLAWAGWTGLLVTGLNLIPIGQLDGGHILYSLIGERARYLFYPLIGAMLVLVLTGSEAWLFWLILLFIFGRIYAKPLDMITPMDNRRKLIAVFSMIVFALTFVPIPFSFATQTPTLVPQNTIWLPATLMTLYLWRRR